MKNKIVDVVFKKFQSYSFIIFLVLILGAFFALAQINKKDNNVEPVGTTQPTQTTQPIGHDNNVEEEEFKLPLDVDSPEIARGFYDANATTEEQLAAIIQVDNVFFTNTGIDYTIDKETAFDVIASLSGTVTAVNQDTLLGYVVEVENLFGIKTVYSSLATVTVAVGDQISQGDTLGTAGSNNFDEASGVHVHFEVLLGDVYLNPNELIGTKINEFDNE